MLLHTLTALVRYHELQHSRHGTSPRILSELIALKDEIPAEVMQRYRVLEERYGQTALVLLNDDVCMGCFIRQPASALREIAPNLHQCNHCGRLMYEQDHLDDEEVF